MEQTETMEETEQTSLATIPAPTERLSPGQPQKTTSRIASSCEAGYHIEGEEGSQTCVANAYACTNGTAVTTGSPTEHNAQNCSECDDGYHTEGRGGFPNLRRQYLSLVRMETRLWRARPAAHITPKTALQMNVTMAITSEGEEGSQTCAANEYSCPHGGRPVSNDMRPSMHEAISCSACDTTKGYRLKHISGDSGPQTCVANAYSCPFGTAVTTGRPVTHETVNCSECTTAGYELSEANEDNPRTCIRSCGFGAGTEDDPRIICDYTQLKEHEHELGLALQIAGKRKWYD